MPYKSLGDLAKELKVSKSTVTRWADLTREVHEPLYDEAGERWFSEEAVERIRQRRTLLFNAKGELVTTKALEKSEPKLIEAPPVQAGGDGVGEGYWYQNGKDRRWIAGPPPGRRPKTVCTHEKAIDREGEWVCARCGEVLPDSTS